MIIKIRVLPKEMLDQLKPAVGDEPFVIETAGLRLRPANPDFDKVMEATLESIQRYRNDLRAMANVGKNEIASR